MNYVNINPENFNLMFKVSRDNPGMGSVKVEFNPYTHKWNSEINFADGSRYKGNDEDINQSMLKAISCFQDRND